MRRPAFLALGLALGLALALAACAPTGQSGCGPREVTLRNASSLAIEQAYGGDGTPGGWGAELIGASPLPPGAARALRLPGGTRALRMVWVNGRAAELGAIEGCAFASVTLTDTALRAE